MLQKSLVAKVCGPGKATDWFSHACCLLRASEVQNKTFPCGELPPGAQNGVSLVAKNVPGQLALALLKSPASGEAGFL